MKYYIYPVTINRLSNKLELSIITSSIHRKLQSEYQILVFDVGKRPQLTAVVDQLLLPHCHFMTSFSITAPEEV